MTADGRLHLNLRAEGPGGLIGDSLVVYQPTDPRYRAILAHLGPIRPGESVPVRPWPDG